MSWPYHDHPDHHHHRDTIIFPSPSSLSPSSHHHHHHNHQHQQQQHHHTDIILILIIMIDTSISITIKEWKIKQWCSAPSDRYSICQSNRDHVHSSCSLIPCPSWRTLTLCFSVCLELNRDQATPLIQELLGLTGLPETSAFSLWLWTENESPEDSPLWGLRSLHVSVSHVKTEGGGESKPLLPPETVSSPYFPLPGFPLWAAGLCLPLATHKKSTLPLLACNAPKDFSCQSLHVLPCHETPLYFPMPPWEGVKFWVWEAHGSQMSFSCWVNEEDEWGGFAQTSQWTSPSFWERLTHGHKAQNFRRTCWSKSWWL